VLLQSLRGSVIVDSFVLGLFELRFSLSTLWGIRRSPLSFVFSLFLQGIRRVA